jgi:hypothetical protein
MGKRSWLEDKEFSDWFLPEVKAILGLHLIGEAPQVEDQEHNTDLIIIEMKPLRIACRIRSYQYFARYPDEFTIRASRPDGTKTELAKVIEGWGDRSFYGFASSFEQYLEQWYLADLNVFRRELQKGEVPSKLQRNDDGSSTFRAYRWTDFPPDFIVAQGQSSIEFRRALKQQREVELAPLPDDGAIPGFE